MITIDDLKEMTKSLSEDENTMFMNIARVMCVLRTMDLDALDRMITIQKLAMSRMPDQLKPAFMSVITDVVLIRAFVEQAKAYDQTKEGIESFESIFGDIITGEEVK